jgi:hypothetical protein
MGPSVPLQGPIPNPTHTTTPSTPHPLSPPPPEPPTPTPKPPHPAPHPHPQTPQDGSIDYAEFCALLRSQNPEVKTSARTQTKGLFARFF